MSWPRLTNCLSPRYSDSLSSKLFSSPSISLQSDPWSFLSQHGFTDHHITSRPQTHWDDVIASIPAAAIAFHQLKNWKRSAAKFFSRSFAHSPSSPPHSSPQFPLNVIEPLLSHHQSQINLILQEMITLSFPPWLDFDELAFLEMQLEYFVDSTLRSQLPCILLSNNPLAYFNAVINFLKFKETKILVLTSSSSLLGLSQSFRECLKPTEFIVIQNSENLNSTLSQFDGGFLLCSFSNFLENFLVFEQEFSFSSIFLNLFDLTEFDIVWYISEKIYRSSHLKFKVFSKLMCMSSEQIQNCRHVMSFLAPIVFGFKDVFDALIDLPNIEELISNELIDSTIDLTQFDWMSGFLPSLGFSIDFSDVERFSFDWKSHVFESEYLDTIDDSVPITTLPALETNLNLLVKARRIWFSSDLAPSLNLKLSFDIESLLDFICVISSFDYDFTSRILNLSSFFDRNFSSILADNSIRNAAFAVFSLPKMMQFSNFLQSRCQSLYNFGDLLSKHCVYLKFEKFNSLYYPPVNDFSKTLHFHSNTVFRNFLQHLNSIPSGSRCCVCTASNSLLNSFSMFLSLKLPYFNKKVHLFSFCVNTTLEQQYDVFNRFESSVPNNSIKILCITQKMFRYFNYYRKSDYLYFLGKDHLLSFFDFHKLGHALTVNQLLFDFDPILSLDYDDNEVIVRFLNTETSFSLSNHQLKSLSKSIEDDDDHKEFCLLFNENHRNSLELDLNTSFRMIEGSSKQRDFKLDPDFHPSQFPIICENSQNLKDFISDKFNDIYEIDLIDPHPAVKSRQDLLNPLFLPPSQFSTTPIMSFNPPSYSEPPDPITSSSFTLKPFSKPVQPEEPKPIIEPPKPQPIKKRRRSRVSQSKSLDVAEPKKKRPLKKSSLKDSTRSLTGFELMTFQPLDDYYLLRAVKECLGNIAFIRDLLILKTGKAFAKSDISNRINFLNSSEGSEACSTAEGVGITFFSGFPVEISQTIQYFGNISIPPSDTKQFTSILSSILSDYVPPSSSQLRQLSSPTAHPSWQWTAMQAALPVITQLSVSSLDFGRKRRGSIEKRRK
ncbi:hypothetical protein GEMRC1_011797 [Eukaryota sp. GEM-RC1]